MDVEKWEKPVGPFLGKIWGHLKKTRGGKIRNPKKMGIKTTGGPFKPPAGKTRINPQRGVGKILGHPP